MTGPASDSRASYDFATCKVCGAKSPPRYRIRHGTVHVCTSCTLHFLDCLDEYPHVTPGIDKTALTDEAVRYIETQLQSSDKRYDNHVRLLAEYGPLDGKRILDVGCGGGLFLKKVRDLGADVLGVELDNRRAAYCMSKHSLDIVRCPIESHHWKQFGGAFDFVTLWDVVEHVNFPLATVRAASELLKPGGILVLDTPARDAFYYRAGVATYRLSLGRLPTFLNVMYSNRPFGHKQILSTQTMKRLLGKCGLTTIKLQKFHELAFPYRFYLEKVLRSDLLARLTSPMAAAFFGVFRIRNKMIAVGRKDSF